jgi:hypothetical protein
VVRRMATRSESRVLSNRTSCSDDSVTRASRRRWISTRTCFRHSKRMQPRSLQRCYIADDQVLDQPTRRSKIPHVGIVRPPRRHTSPHLTIAPTATHNGSVASHQGKFSHTQPPFCVENQS